jgi:hypothetical protein
MDNCLKPKDFCAANSGAATGVYRETQIIWARADFTLHGICNIDTLTLAIVNPLVHWIIVRWISGGSQDVRTERVP